MGTVLSRVRRSFFTSTSSNNVDRLSEGKVTKIGEIMNNRC